MSDTKLNELIFRQTYLISTMLKAKSFSNDMEEDQLIGKYIAYHDLINKAGLVSEYGQFKKAMQH
ncbi:MAG: hypothetical protein IJ133_02280 [Clostridia bacterium]|nr:hypothetical protein [Clostridia bacterium]